MEFVLYEAKDKIAAITLNRPEARNAQNKQMLDELDACWTKAARGRRRPRDRAEGERPALLVGARHRDQAGRGHDHRPEEQGPRGDLPLRARPLPRLLAQVARRAEALDRRRAGRLHRGRHDAVLAVRPDPRRRERLLQRSGAAHGHRRRRVPRAHLGVRREEGQGAALHRRPLRRARGAPARHGEPRGARPRSSKRRPSRSRARSPRCTPSRSPRRSAW